MSEDVISFLGLEIKDPFPQLQTRDIFYPVCAHIVQEGQRQSLDRMLKGADFDEKDRGKIKEFIALTKRYKDFPADIKASYVSFWQTLWDIFGYHKIVISKLGQEAPEEGTKEWVALKTMELDSAKTQQLRRDAVEIIGEGRYEDLFKLVLQHEQGKSALFKEMGAKPPHNAGLQLAYADALLFLAMAAKDF